MEKAKRKGKPGCPLTMRGEHVLVGVLAEDVLNDHNGFLDHIVDLGLDEIKQCAHTALCRLLCGKKRQCRQGLCTVSNWANDTTRVKQLQSPAPFLMTT